MYGQFGQCKHRRIERTVNRLLFARFYFRDIHKDDIFANIYWAKKESIHSVYIPIIYVQLNEN